jgi:hypothetical protein
MNAIFPSASSGQYHLIKRGGGEGTKKSCCGCLVRVEENSRLKRSGKRTALVNAYPNLSWMFLV